MSRTSQAKVASGPVVPEDELPPRLPKEWEGESVLGKKTSNKMLSCGGTGFMQGCRGGMAAETFRARESFGDVQAAD